MLWAIKIWKLDPRVCLVIFKRVKHIDKFLFIIALLPLISSCEKTSQRINQEQATRDIEQSHKELSDSMKMTDEGLQVDRESLEKHRKNLESAGEKMGGKKGEAMKIVAEIQGELNEFVKKHETATTQFLAAIDWSQLAKDQDYEERRNTLKEFITSNEQMRDKTVAFHQTVLDRLDKIGFQGSERDNFDKGFLQNRDQMNEIITTIRQCDIDVSNISISVIDRLEKLGDEWQWNKEDKNITFTYEADAKWFNAQMDEFSKKAETQLQAQEKMVNMMKGL